MTERRAGPAIWIATAGGAGYFPIAPGTAGSVVGVAAVVGLGRLPLPHAAAIVVLAAASLALFGVGVWAAGEAEKFFGRTDPGEVVIDEVVGQMLTFLVIPHAYVEMAGGRFPVVPGVRYRKTFSSSTSRANPARLGYHVR